MSAPALDHSHHSCGDHNCEGQSLWKFIDHAGVRCLNAAVGSAAQAVLRPWERRRERLPVLESNEDDCELLLYVPFTSDVKARGQRTHATPVAHTSRSSPAWWCPAAGAAPLPSPCARS